MGVKIFDLMQKHEIELDELNGKIMAIDAHLVLYQFLSTIRQPDGTPLKDSSGKITSHLQGLFARSTNLMQKGIKMVFVFDGKAPDLKKRVRQKRNLLKEKAVKDLEIATQSQDIELMKKYAQRTSRLDSSMIAEAKDLLTCLGIPIVQAPSEAEAQAARIVLDGKAFAVGTQDADSLMFGAPILIKNLTVSEKRKAPNKLSYIQVKPEKFLLKECLDSLDITQDQLIALSILVGTDYNPGGVKGIGPRKALSLVKKEKDFDSLFKSAGFSDPDVSWKEIFDTIKSIPTTSDYEINFGKVDDQSVINLLCEKHDFSRERVESSLKKIKPGPQAGLSQWV